MFDQAECVREKIFLHDPDIRALQLSRMVGAHCDPRDCEPSLPCSPQMSNIPLLGMNSFGKGTFLEGVLYCCVDCNSFGKAILMTSLSSKVWLEVAQLLWCHFLRTSQDISGLIGASQFAWKLSDVFFYFIPVFVIVYPTKTLPPLLRLAVADRRQRRPAACSTACQQVRNGSIFIFYCFSVSTLINMSYVILCILVSVYYCVFILLMLFICFTHICNIFAVYVYIPITCIYI